jgi:hypothetical protein
MTAETVGPFNLTHGELVKAALKWLTGSCRCAFAGRNTLVGWRNS